MELRYRTQSAHYIPEFKTDEGDWREFRVKDVPPVTRKIAEQIGNLQLPMRWEPGQWFYVNKGIRECDSAVFFTSEIYVMAFLGAIKAELTPRTVDFKI